MALGTLGSTLNDELNRLANGGTYRDMNQMVDEALAAKQWANRENINPYSTDTVGILNEIAGLGLDKRNWLDFNGVCNYIAGTTGLPAAAALRQVYPTTDLLTGVASYYVDGYAGSNYIPTTASGYMYLPGVAGNYASAPDSSALDITGDIDLRVRLSLDDWYSTATALAKWVSTGNQRSYAMSVVGGLLRMQISSNGSGVTTIDSNATFSFNVGDIKWIRSTVDVDNGAGGYNVQFFTSDNGTSWTQLGTTITNAGTTSFFNSTSPLEIGSLVTGTTQVARGRFYQAQVRNGIDGTIVFNANFETAMTSQTVTSFTESSSNAATVTINRTTYNFQLDTIANLGAAGSLLPTTLGSSTAADSNDPKFLDFTGTNYVYLPGVNGNRMSVPDANNLDITGDLTLVAKANLDNWSSASIQSFIRKGGFGPENYGLYAASGQLFLAYNDGTWRNRASVTTVPFANGTDGWVKATLDVDNGAGGVDVKFYTSTDGVNFTQLGTTKTFAGTITLSTNSSIVSIGSELNAQETPAGKIYRAQIFDGIDGTKVLDVDTSVITAGSATSFTAVTGQTVTINRSTSGRKTVAVTQPTWLFGTDDYMEVNNRYMSSGTYLYLPGVASNYASAPDSAALDITGDIDLRVKVALDDWTPAATNTLIAKRSDTTAQQSYILTATPTGGLQLGWSTAGTSLITQSSLAHSIPDGTTKWVRATLDVDNGAGGYEVKFFLSDDGTNWTQLGTTITGVGTTSIFNSTAALEVGAQVSGLSSVISRGKFFRAQVLNGINGTVAFDANFETSITSLNQASFTESSANAATVTINRSGSAYRSAGITAAGYLYPGATNTFAASATDFLNFGASDSFTAVAVWRQWDTSPSRVILSSSGSIGGGYFIYQHTLNRAYFQITDTVQFPSTFLNVPVGSLAAVSGVRNVALDRLEGYLGTASPVTSTDTTTGTLRNFGTLRIGAQFNGVNADAEIYAAAVFRQTLTAAQIRQIANYFANREVYL